MTLDDRPWALFALSCLLGGCPASSGPAPDGGTEPAKREAAAGDGEVSKAPTEAPPTADPAEGGAETGAAAGTEGGGEETGGSEGGETGGSEGGETDTGETGETDTGETGGEDAAAETSAATLIVGGSKGLVEYDLDGKQLRTLTPMAAAWPRILPDGEILFLHPKAPNYELMRVAKADGAVTAVATLPRNFNAKTCKVEFSEDYLDVQSDWGFSVDVANKRACFNLADRNENMAELEIEVRVDLDTGKVHSRLEEMMDGDCPPDAAFECGGSSGGGGSMNASEQPTGEAFAWRWDPDAWLIFPKGTANARTNPKAVSVCSNSVDFNDPESMAVLCASEEGRSPSGRFVLLSGMLSMGDYIHRELYFIDLSTGELLGMLGDDRKFEVVTPDNVMTEVFGSLDAVGESLIRWVGDAKHERLWVDGWLIDPAGRKTIRVDGFLASQL